METLDTRPHQNTKTDRLGSSLQKKKPSLKLLKDSA